MKHLIKALVACVLIAAPLLRADNKPAEDPVARLEKAREVSKTLKPQSGDIELSGGIARISLSDGFRYLNPDDEEKVLSDIWGNPRVAKGLGMIVPKDFDPLMPGSWVVAISYSEDGYIKDDDANKLNYDELMQKMKDATKDDNKQRVAQGYPEVELVGWATPPKYDAATHKMYWAKAIRFANHRDETLNYNIRILGRRGVLVLNAIAGMDQLGTVEAMTPSILAMVNFKQGSRYADFDSSTDKVATYGLAALVLGGIAAKAGFFKLLLVGILAAKKFVILAAIAVAAYFKKLYRKWTGREPEGGSPTPPAS